MTYKHLKLRKLFINYYIYLLICLGIVIYTFCSIRILSIPIFADGTQHTWITDYVSSNGRLPSSDFTGIQSTNLSVPRSIKNPSPFIYSPLFYVLSGSLATIGLKPADAVTFLCVLFPILIAIFLFIFCRRNFNDHVALLVYFLALFSSLWPWMTSHRIVEPLIVLLFVLIFTYILKPSKSSLLISLVFLVALFGTKASVYPIVISTIIYIAFKYSLRISLVFIALFIMLIVPFILFSYSNIRAPYPTPIGIKPIDNMFKDAWWNQNLASWEIKLNQSVNNNELKAKTYSQFKEVQKSPSNLYHYAGIPGVINEYSLYPISSISTEGYQSTVPTKLYLIFSILLICGIIAVLQLIRNENKAFIKSFLLYTSLLVIFTTLVWFKQPVFRYYIYITVLSVIIYALGIDFIKKYSNPLIYTAVLCITFLVVTYSLNSEIHRDKTFIYTAMHQRVPTQDAGLYDSINFSKSILNSRAKEIMTPMVEISYYSKKSQVWDNRLFFIKNKDDLVDYLNHYDFQYVVVPFYSGKSTLSNWRYDQGIPSDSVFNELLNDHRYFKLVNSNNAFKAYRKIDE